MAQPPPVLPSVEARRYQYPDADWLEHVDGVWRAWRQLINPTGAYIPPREPTAIYEISAEVDGSLGWEDALIAIAAILWPDEPGIDDWEYRHREEEREYFPEAWTERQYRAGSPFGRLRHMRWFRDVAGLRAIALASEMTEDSLEALAMLSYLVVEGTTEAGPALEEALFHPHPRIRGEAVEIMAFVRVVTEHPDRSLGCRSPDQWCGMPRIPLIHKTPWLDEKIGTFEPWMRFSDILEIALRDEDPDVRGAGLRYVLITHLESVDGRELLHRSMREDPSPMVRAHARRLLFVHGDPEVTSWS